MRAVDTNVLIRITIGDDVRQTRKADAFVEGGVRVSHVVLAEATWVLRSVYDVSHAGIAAAIDKWLDHEHLSLQDRDVVAAALALYRRRPALKFSDCLLLAIARKAGDLPLGTFDRDLGKLEGATQL